MYRALIIITVLITITTRLSGSDAPKIGMMTFPSQSSYVFTKNHDSNDTAYAHVIRDPENGSYMTLSEYNSSQRRLVETVPF